MRALRPRLLLISAPLVLFVLAGLTAPLLAPYGPGETDLAASLQPPGWEHPLGTDQLGRDEFSRLLFAARTSLQAVGAVLAVTVTVGVVVGAVAGYVGGRAEGVVVGLIDVALGLPSVVIALAVVGLRGDGLGNLVLALSLTGWAPYARIARARIAATRRLPHVDALRVLGARPRRILGRHLLPTAWGPSLVYASTDAGTTVLGVATLSFLGLGITPPTPEWGQMLVDARPFIGSASWLVLPPGLAVTAVVISCNLLGEHLATTLGVTNRRALLTIDSRPTPGPERDPRATRISTKGPTGGDEAVLYEVAGLTVRFATPRNGGRGQDPLAVDGVGYRVRQGEALALVGESGCGKTASVLAPLGLLPAPATVAGSARLRGTEVLDLEERDLRAVRGRAVGVAFQDASSALNPVRSVGAQIREAVRNAGELRGRAAAERAVELLGLVGLPDPRRLARDHPHQLSGGMRQRVLIAAALAGEPDLLVADEPTTALDATVQAEIVALLRRLRDGLGMAMILVSHDIAVVAELADEVAVMYAGKVVETGPRETVLRAPDHPYTRGLLDAVPRLNAAPGARFATMPGRPPDSPEGLAGCAFAPRCAWAVARCAHERPPLERVGSADARRRSACWVHPATVPSRGDSR